MLDVLMAVGNVQAMLLFHLSKRTFIDFYLYKRKFKYYRKQQTRQRKKLQLIHSNFYSELRAGMADRQRATNILLSYFSYWTKSFRLLITIMQYSATTTDTMYDDVLPLPIRP